MRLIYKLNTAVLAIALVAGFAPSGHAQGDDGGFGLQRFANIAPAAFGDDNTATVSNPAVAMDDAASALQDIAPAAGDEADLIKDAPAAIQVPQGETQETHP